MIWKVFSFTISIQSVKKSVSVSEVDEDLEMLTLLLRLDEAPPLQKMETQVQSLKSISN